MADATPDRWGIATGYHDVTGNWRQAPPSTIEAILDAMGAGEDDPTSWNGTILEAGEARLREADEFYAGIARLLRLHRFRRSNRNW